MTTTAYRSLIKAALKQGYTVSVWGSCDPERLLGHSSGFKEICEAIKAVEEAEVVFYDEKKMKQVGWALISAYGLAPEETVIDTTTQPWLNEWFDKLYESLES